MRMHVALAGSAKNPPKCKLTPKSTKEKHKEIEYNEAQRTSNQHTV